VWQLAAVFASAVANPGTEQKAAASCRTPNLWRILFVQRAHGDTLPLCRDECGCSILAAAGKKSLLCFKTRYDSASSSTRRRLSRRRLRRCACASEVTAAISMPRSRTRRCRRTCAACVTWAVSGSPRHGPWIFTLTVTKNTNRQCSCRESGWGHRRSSGDRRPLFAVKGFAPRLGGLAIDGHFR